MSDVARRLADIEQREKEAELKALRAEIASEMDVPKELRQFLSADTKDEMREQAEALLEAVKGAGVEKDEEDADYDPAEAATRASSPHVDLSHIPRGYV